MFFLFLGSPRGYAQQYKISGYVLDNSTIEAIPSATIKLPNNQYKISQENGAFSFEIAIGDTAIFTSIGYTPYNFVIRDSSQLVSNFHVYMKSMSYTLGGVEVHGEKKKGAVVKATDFLDDVSSPMTFFSKDARSKRQIEKIEKQEAIVNRHIYWQVNNELITQLSGFSGAELDSCTVYCNTHIDLVPNDTRMSITHKLLLVISEYMKKKH